MKSPEELQARWAEMYPRLKRPAQYALEQAKRVREDRAFRRIGRYLDASERALEEERRITALYGCQTSWSQVEAAGKYFTYVGVKSVPRVARPAAGGNWPFQRQFRKAA